SSVRTISPVMVADSALSCFVLFIRTVATPPSTSTMSCSYAIGVASHDPPTATTAMSVARMARADSMGRHGRVVGGRAGRAGGNDRRSGARAGGAGDRRARGRWDLPSHRGPAGQVRSGAGAVGDLAPGH